MDFLKRLGFYLIGLSIGIIFLVFFFKKKSDETGVSFCYFPNCRTLKDIRSKPLLYSDEINALLQNKTLDSAAINSFLYDGEVNFSESDTKAKPCKHYQIEGQLKAQKAVLHITNCATKAMVQKVTYSEE